MRIKRYFVRASCVVWIVLFSQLAMVRALDWPSSIKDLKKAALQEGSDTANGLLERALAVEKKDPKAERAMSAEMKERAAEARRLFESFCPQEYEAEIYDPAKKDEAKRLLERYRNVVAKYRGRSSLAPEELAELARAIMPFFRYVCLCDDACIEGTEIEVASFEKAKVIVKGFCLDHSIGAPSTGERLQLVDAERLIAPEILDLYRALLRSLAEGRCTNRSMVQNLLWGIRHAEQKIPHIRQINAEQRRLLDIAMPGGGDVYQRYLDRMAARYESRTARRAVLAGIRKAIRDRLGECMPEPQTDGFSDLDTERLVSQLCRLPVEGDPVEGSEYSMLAPGVSAKATCVSGLSPVCIEVVNTTGSPVQIDLSNFVGQSVRVSQRVALSGLSDSGAAFLGRLLDVLRLLEIESLKEVQRLIQASIDEYSKRNADSSFDQTAAFIATELNQFLFPISVLDVIPALGKAGKLGKAFVKSGARIRAIDAGLAVEERIVRTTVLGHYPEYTQLAERVGARSFQIPERIWSAMTDSERWTANQKFLDRLIERGDDVLLATPIDKVKAGSYFERELEYLFEKGYRLSPDGTKLVHGG